MITITLLLCLIGLIVWLIFTKWNKVADSWVAEVGRLTFFAALLAWLLSLAGKVAY